jgi:ABC-type transporter MlaC component
LRDFFVRVNGLIQAPEDQMTLAARLALIHRMTHQVFDVHRAAANVLGKEWTARTPSEQEEFVDLFGDVLQRGYLALIGSKVRITGGVHVTFLDEAVAGDVAVVRTALTARSNGELSIDYRMSRADGTWWVVDTIIGGVSLVANYRAQIVRIRQHSTHRELIALMRSMVRTSTNPETAVAETVTPTDTTTAAGADTPVAAAVRTLPVEMTAVSVTAPSAPAPTRAASLPANTFPIAAPPAATNTLRAETVRDAMAPSLTRADTPVAAAARTLPIEMTAVSMTAPSVPAPRRAASLPANTSPIAAPPTATNTPCGETVPNTTAPSLTLRSAQRDPKRFWVQIGAFRDSESAAQLVERLADPGVMIVTLPSPGRSPVPLMWVCVGPFTTQSAVDAKARELTAAGYHALIATQLP